MNSHVLPLSEAKDVQLVGGKAHSLCKMIQNDFNVPEGFVISATGVYAGQSEN